MIKRLVAIGLALVLILLWLSPVYAAPTTFTSTVIAQGDSCITWIDSTTNTPHLSTAWNGVQAGTYDQYYTRMSSGMRFLSIPIPQGSSIISAYLQLTSYNDSDHPQSSSPSMTTIITGQASGNALGFTSYADYISRPRTSAQVIWPIYQVWPNSQAIQPVDVSPIIREITSRSDWIQGNSLVLFWGDYNNPVVSGYSRRAYSVGSSGSGSGTAPTLSITYDSSNVASSNLFTNPPSSPVTGSSDSADIANLTTIVGQLQTQITDLSNTVKTTSSSLSSTNSTLQTILRNTDPASGTISTAVKQAVNDELKGDPTLQGLSQSLTTTVNQLTTLNSDVKSVVDKQDALGKQITLIQQSEAKSSALNILIVLVIVLIGANGITIYNLMKTNKKPEESEPPVEGEQ